MNKIALLFPGQGSQYVGMGKRLYSQFPSVKKVFEEANDILGYDITKLCFEGSLEELTRTDNTQPALLTTSVATYKAYSEYIGIQPYCMAGHSLGEFSALCCSSSITFADALKIVRKRGQLMHKAAEQGEGAMAAVGGVDYRIIESICAEASNEASNVGVACYNSPEQTVISGHADAVKLAGDKLKTLGAQVTYLKVSAAFHSSLMLNAANDFRNELELYEFKQPNFVVIANVNGLPYVDKLSIKENLVLQMYNPVQWKLSMQQMFKMGVRTAVEIGPKTVLKNLSNKNVKYINSFSYDKEDDIKEFFRLTNTKDKINAHSLIDRCIAEAVCTKNYNYNEEEYQRGVIDNYRILQNMQSQLNNQGSEATKDQMLDAVKILKEILMSKLLPESQQLESLKRILEESSMSSLLSHIS